MTTPRHPQFPISVTARVYMYNKPLNAEGYPSQIWAIPRLTLWRLKSDMLNAQNFCHVFKEVFASGTWLSTRAP